MDALHIKTEDRIIFGLAMRLLAVLLLSGMSALIKLAEAHGAALSEIMFFRQALAIPVVLVMMALGPGLGAVRTRAFRGQFIRAAVGTTGMFFTFGTLLLLPLAEATTLSFTTPIFATILGALVLRETTGWHRWSAVVAGFVGVIVVTQPGSGHFPIAGTACGLVAALFVAMVAIQLRRIGKTDLPVTTVFWFSVLSTIPLGIIYIFFARMHDATTFAILVSIGVSGGLGQVAFSTALRYAPVSSVMPMDYSGLLWATLFGWVLFAALPTPSTWLGAPIIIASGLYIVWREHRLGKANALAAASTAP